MNAINILTVTSIILAILIIILFALFLIKNLKKKSNIKKEISVQKFKYCIECGEKIDIKDKYCDICGAKQ